MCRCARCVVHGGQRTTLWSSIHFCMHSGDQWGSVPGMARRSHLAGLSFETPCTDSGAHPFGEASKGPQVQDCRCATMCGHFTQWLSPSPWIVFRLDMIWLQCVLLWVACLLCDSSMMLTLLAVCSLFGSNLCLLVDGTFRSFLVFRNCE